MAASSGAALLAASLGRFPDTQPTHGRSSLVQTVASRANSAAVLDGQSVARGVPTAGPSLMMSPTAPRQPRTKGASPGPRGRWVPQPAGSPRRRSSSAKESELASPEPARGRIRAVRLSASGHAPRRGSSATPLAPLGSSGAGAGGFSTVDGRSTIYAETQRDQQEVIDQMRTEMQCMQADMRAEMRREMGTMRRELDAKNDELRELAARVPARLPTLEPEPEPEPHAVTIEQMLVEMLEEDGDPGRSEREPARLAEQKEAACRSPARGVSPLAPWNEEEGAQSEASEVLAEVDADTRRSQAEADVRSDVRTVVNELLDVAVDRMDLPETQAQLAENEPPVMHDLVGELLDTAGKYTSNPHRNLISREVSDTLHVLSVDRMGLPEMDRSDFREMTSGKYTPQFSPQLGLFSGASLTDGLRDRRACRWRRGSRCGSTDANLEQGAAIDRSGVAR